MELKLKRKIDNYLVSWKQNPERLPLIVKGARQIGKTFSIELFAQSYKSFVEINFVTSPEYKAIFETGFSVENIVKQISMINPKFQFIPHKTLIFFDELQSCPNCATCLKFFALHRQYDVICSGSLMGINYQEIESVSVGYKTDYEMYSLDFEEFLWSMGYNHSLKEDILDHMLNIKPLNNTLKNTMESLFLDYAVLGGMPEIVAEYCSTKAFSKSQELKKQIVLAYREDIKKYATGVDQTRITQVFDSVPVQLAKENKKFQISKVASGARFHNYAGCIDWLQDAGIIQKCYCLHFPELPLKGNFEPSKFKIYFSDTGLLISMLDDESQEDLRVNKNLGVYKGALYESIVGESLYKQGYSLFYYKREDGTLEEDFFIRDINNLIPIEVKARTGQSQSMKSLITNNKYEDIKWGIKLSLNNIGFENNLYTFPYYCSFLLKEWVSNKK